MKDLQKQINELKRRVERLERKPKHGERLNQIAEWVVETLKENGRMSSSKLMEEAKYEGYSSQMVGRARREVLKGKVLVTSGFGKGWTWELNKVRAKRLDGV